jgi:DME family drug/metabolite transporter
MERTTMTGWAGGPGAVLAAAGLWGTVGPAQVLADAPLGPAALGGWRLLLGGALLAAWSLRRRGALRGLGRREAWPWILLAALATGVFQAAFLASVQHLGAALATAVALGTAPAATGVLATVWTGERLGARWVVGATTTVAGCVLLLAPSGGSAAIGVGGLALGVLAGGCYGAYTVAAKRLSTAGVDPIGAVAVTLLLGALVLLPSVAADTAGLGAGATWLLIGWLAIGATGAAYWLFVRGLRGTRASTAGVLSLLEPLVAAVLGVAVLGERLTGTTAVGAVVLLAGVALAAVPGRRAAGAPTPAPAPPA